MSNAADRERDRRSLQDLAKMAAMTPPPASVSMPAASSGSGVQRAGEAKGDDSGLIDLSAASLADPGAAQRAQSTPLATQGLFDDEPQSVRPPPMSAQPAQPVPSIAPHSMPPASLAPQAPAFATPQAPSVAPSVPQAMPGAMPSNVHAFAPPAKKKGGAVVGLLVAVVFALSAAAAGTSLYLKMHKEPVTVATMAAPTATLTAATPAPTTDPTPAPTGEATTDPNALPTAAPKTAAKAAPPVHHNGNPGAVAAAPKEAPKEPPKVAEKDLPTAPTGPAGALGDEMRKSVGANDAVKPAAASSGATSTGNVPTKPSQGAVTGAIGAVLPAARACLGPDDPISRASVVFSSDGSVQSVSVSGGAAGKPAEACIKGALSKAKVQPFAEASYTAPITIRHN